jgi:ATP-dependent RNA helicase RhlE
MSFEKLGLSAELLRSISEKGYKDPTSVQSQAIPPILKGKDAVVSAQTGTGKTAAFTLPILQRLLQRLSEIPAKNNYNKRSIYALILTPTRELAAQVFDNVKMYGKYLPFKSAKVFGGVNINPQIKQLQSGVDILIATPGRLLDLIKQGVVDLSKVEMFVLDEADRMLDMGFIRDIRKVINLLPERRQNLLFSATFSKEIKVLADKLLSSPARIEVARSTTTAEQITQVIYPVDKLRKRELLSFMIGSKNWQQVLVFTRTKHGANRLMKQLEVDGLTAAAIHGNKSQAARTRALADFKAGKICVLVATDIAARGLDIAKLPHVVNFELPNVPEDYVHRIGRTGRASHHGLAISLVCIDEHKLLKDIEKLLRYKIPQEIIPGYEPNPDIKAEPIQMRSANNNRGKPSSLKQPPRKQQTRYSEPSVKRKSNKGRRKP